MKNIFITSLVLISAIASAADFNKDMWSAETMIFGASYHTNRNIHWNENNTGLGLGLVYKLPNDFDTPAVEATLLGGMYKDSYDEWAKFLMPGLRFNNGDMNRFHWNIGLNIGYYDGSSFNGLGILPSIGIGWNRVDLCFTGSPARPGPKSNPNGSSDPQENRITTSGFIAAFIRIKVASW
jgi:opacity protein-like surface antigen